jgi:hypothetical protein
MRALAAMLAFAAGCPLLGVAACASARSSEPPPAGSDPPISHFTSANGAGPTETAPPPADAPITLVAVGDIMLGSSYPYPDGRDLPPPDPRPAGLMTPFAPLLQGADIAFGNLEGVIVASDDTSAKPKCDGRKKGCFAFRMPLAFAPHLQAAGFDMLSLANNHAFDFGEEGRSATRSALDGLKIAYSGRRGDIARLVIRGVRVSMIALSNYEHSYDLNDLAAATRAIADEAAHSDILVVSFPRAPRSTPAPISSSATARTWCARSRSIAAASSPTRSATSPRTNASTSTARTASLASSRPRMRPRGRARQGRRLPLGQGPPAAPARPRRPRAGP